jgi:hypothetical protein
MSSENTGDRIGLGIQLQGLVLEVMRLFLWIEALGR